MCSKYTPRDIRRFWSKVKKTGPNECWEWQAGINPKTGYGKFWIHGKTCLAHRVSFEIANAKEVSETNVLHSCDNRRCVNPAHLWTGTALDNMHDMISKGRKVVHRGVDHPYCKLTDEQVITIKTSTDQTQQELADQFHVSQSLIWKVKKELTRKLVGGINEPDR